MTPSMMDSRRTSARVVLVMIAATLALFMLFSGGPGGAISIAQQPTTPTGTIQLLNPSKNSNLEVTAVENDADTGNDAFHLVAWVSNNPPNASVEFSYQTSGQQEQKICRLGEAPPCTGSGTLVGDDTYELFWPEQTMPADGDYTLRVKLFSGTVLVSQDEETVRVNNTDPGTPSPPVPQGTGQNVDKPNGVEILYPANGQAWGLFSQTPTGAPSGMIDIQASPGVANVTPYYSISGTGSEPVWKDCGGETRADALADGVRCTLIDNDRPEAVKAVAVVPDDRNVDLATTADKDAPDAHRTTGYVQNATTLTIAPATQRKDAAGGQSFECSNPITATVLDQNGRRIVGANVDVHAQGPSDRLAFDGSDADTNTDANQPPDQAHGPTEAGVNCESQTQPSAPANQSGVQREHELGTDNDIKHIESAGSGTSQAGTFKFQLFSPDAGETEFVVWADEDGDDRFCGAEASVAGAIGYNQDPTITGVAPDTTNCPEASPTTTATSTGTVSPTPTETSTATATTSPTPTETASPTPTETATPGPELTVSRTRFKAFKFQRRGFDKFKGQIGNDDNRCNERRFVTIKKARQGRRDKFIGTARTDRFGRFRLLKDDPNGRFYAKARPRTITEPDGDQVDCLPARSDTIRVRRRG